MSSQFLSRQILAFLVTGGTAALINFGGRIAYSRWVGFSAAAHAIGVPAPVFTSCLGHKHWSFR